MVSSAQVGRHPQGLTIVGGGQIPTTETEIRVRPIRYAVGVVGSKGEPDSVPFLAALLGILAAGHDFIYLLVYTDLNVVRFLVVFFTVALPSALYTAIVGVVVHKIALYSEAKVVKSFGKARP